MDSRTQERSARRAAVNARYEEIKTMEYLANVDQHGPNEAERIAREKAAAYRKERYEEIERELPN